MTLACLGEYRPWGAVRFDQRRLVGAVFQDMSTRSMTYRVSDHLPLWVEFMTDRSVEALALTLGVDPDMPKPFAGVTD